MITIPQYETLFSVYITAVALIPCIILCFWGKKYKVLDLAISVLFIALFLGVNSIRMFEFVGFVIYETILIYCFLLIKKKHATKSLFYLTMILSMIPILVVRISVFKPEIKDLIGFTGLSYMCFKIWQILIEIHDEKIDKIGIVDLWLFILFFPSFTSGPIARYQSFVQSFDEDIRDTYSKEYFVPGIKRIYLGLFYKLAVSFFINEFIMSKLSNEGSLYEYIVYMYSYTLFLFFDFAGYSNIAIGVGQLMGIKLPENFNKPFLAGNMKEFWARWHMSLSTWFSDYVYGRVTLAGVRSGLIRNPKMASRVAYMVTMLLMGLWHGFSLHYIIYGLYEGILLVVSDCWIKSATYRTVRKKKYYNLISRVICFQFIAFGMLLFSGRYIFDA